MADAGISLYALAVLGNNKTKLFTRVLELASIIIIIIITCPHFMCSATPYTLPAAKFSRNVGQFRNIHKDWP